MKLHPLRECMRKADELVGRGNAEVFQQFICAHCGVKNEIDEPNTFYANGLCARCGQGTNIEADGCNMLVHFTSRKH